MHLLTIPVVVIISQFTGVSNRYVVYLKLTQRCVSIISVKLGEKGKIFLKKKKEKANKV